MKVPRDVNAGDLIKLMAQLGYIVIRQTGSHIRISKIINGNEHAITVPNHKPIKIGTLQNIAKDICLANKYDINDFYNKL